MSRILILDKDGTLTKSVSGSTFIQHPQDQVLIEGVADAIDRYHKAGWAIVIASNQGGCDLSIVLGRKVPVGAYIPIDGQDYKITGIRKDENMDDPMLHFQLDRERSNGKQYYSAYPESRVSIRYKTIEDAIEEMRYCMKLLPQIEYALFCPDFEGKTCYQIKRNEVDLWEGEMENWYRKPGTGMIALAVFCNNPRNVNNLLVVGDRPEDQQAAEAANVQFMWANEWVRSNP